MEKRIEKPEILPVQIKVDSVVLDGDLSMSADPQGIVIFAHGSGSSRLSRRNRFVAQLLVDAGLATLLFDLLTTPEVPRVKAPTLLIVGGKDFSIISLNKEAFDMLEVEKELIIIPGATHLFEEPGALDKVAELATSWFLKYLRPGLPVLAHV